MDDVYITESGMVFGPFSKESVFRIENCDLYLTKYRQNGIKTCEFVLQRDGKLYFIEAKKTCPNHSVAMQDEDKQKNMMNIYEIYHKK